MVLILLFLIECIANKVKTVLLRGQVAIDNNKCLVKKGYGQFVKRSKVSQVI